MAYINEPENKSTEWETPWDKFLPWHHEFQFTVDVAAQPWNRKLPTFFTPLDDGLRQSWAGQRCWCNPPYGSESISQWIRKGLEAQKEGALVVFLLPNTTEQPWFHMIWDDEKNRTMPGVELRFHKGRINFIPPPGQKATANVKGSILVVMRPIEVVKYFWGIPPRGGMPIEGQACPVCQRPL